SNRFGSNQNRKSQPSPPPTASTLILLLPATTGVLDTSQKKFRKLDKSSVRLDGLLAGEKVARYAGARLARAGYHRRRTPRDLFSGRNASAAGAGQLGIHAVEGIRPRWALREELRSSMVWGTNSIATTARSNARSS